VTTVALYSEDDLLPISALQHLLFCERQCALIHIEGLWAENRLTTEGRHLHERADSGRSETRPGRRITRSLPLRSLRLGLTGIADVVEFVNDGKGGARHLVPVEYKRGRPKQGDEDRVQLCAQALCLEEMLDVSIPTGSLFYGKEHRRYEVQFDEALRTLTRSSAVRLHELILSGSSPRAAREAKCERCSLVDLCLPNAVAPSRSARSYLDRAVLKSLGSSPTSLPEEPP